MDFPDFAPPRVVTHTYKRKRGRGPRFQQHSVAPSPLRNGMSISQYGSDEDESSSRDSSEHKAKTPPPQRMLQPTPPSTPPRKKKSASQASSPAKSSSSSPSKVSIDRELGRIFSPKGTKTESGKQPYSDAEEEDRGISSNETIRDVLLQSPRKPSFADRMGPRKSKKKDASVVEEDDNTMKGETDSDSQGSEVLSGPSGSQEEGSTTIMLPVLLHAPSERVYGRVRNLPEGGDSQSTKMLASDLIESKPCLKELSKRWEELDDLDEGEEEPAIDSITGLRARGQSRRFREDFQYLVLDLRPSQSLADRRSTCVEIAKKVLIWDDEDKDMCSEKEVEWEILPEGSTLTPFLSQVKSAAADLIGQLWIQLRLAGAGKGKDKVLDLVLLLISLKVARSDTALSLDLSRQNGFNRCMAVMMASTYSDAPSGKELQRHVSTLTQLAKSSQLCSSDEGLEVPIIVLQTLSALVDTHGQMNSGSSIDIAQAESKTGFSILGQLWHQLAHEAAAVDGKRLPDHRALSLIAQIIVGCISQVSTTPHLDTSPLDLVTLLRYYCGSELLGEEDEQLDTLSSLLRMTVALMSLDGCTLDNDLIQAEGLLECIVHLTVKGATHLTLTRNMQDDSTRMEPFTLSLALLTDFLVKDPLRARQALLVTEPEEKVALLARLLKQQRQESEIDASSGYLTGSLAVILALLIVSSEAASSQTASNSSKEETLAMEQIKQGLECSTIYAFIVLIRDSLVDFADMVRIAARTQQGTVRAAAKAKDDEDFFVGLSKSLALLLESHSPSQQDQE